jgi:hypothetical protein
LLFQEKSQYNKPNQTRAVIAATIRFGTDISANNPINAAATEMAYLRTFPLRGRPMGDKPEPLHSGHLPLAEQCGQAASDEPKCGLMPVPSHSSHFPEPLQNRQSPNFGVTGGLHSEREGITRLNVCDVILVN